MARPIIALLTDFGTRDHYVGVMKGVALGVCPEAALVDITHDVPPQDVLAGALELAAAYRYFPAGTVFLVVVDPGVGSARRGIAADSGLYRFVAPDNGVLTLVLREASSVRVVELAERAYRRATLSRTFEGRDRFAPAAGWLARGTEITAFGPELGQWIEIGVPLPAVDAKRILGEVLRVDRFGNLVTNLDRTTLERFAEDGAIQVVAGGVRVGTVSGTYADVEAGSVCALVGSTDHLEIAVNGGSAADRLKLKRGDPVELRRVC
jgi:S-adenosylmethionine hydrolase